MIKNALLTFFAFNDNRHLTMIYEFIMNLITPQILKPWWKLASALRCYNKFTPTGIRKQFITVQIFSRNEKAAQLPCIWMH